MWKPTRPKPDEQPEHQQASDEAELLADDREDEVGVCVREEQPLGMAVPEADAVHPAAAERDQRLRDLVAGVRRVLPRMQEREHARAPVRRRVREDGGRGRAGRKQLNRWVPRTPATINIATAITRDHDCGVEVGLLHHEQAEDAEDHEHRRPRAVVVELVGPARQDLGRAHEQCELRDLARLHSQEPERRASGANRRRSMPIPGTSTTVHATTARPSNHGPALRHRW